MKVNTLNPFLEQKEAQARFNICAKRDRFNKTTFICKECWCFMKVKCKLKKSKCPIGKW